VTWPRCEVALTTKFCEPDCCTVTDVLDGKNEEIETEVRPSKFFSIVDGSVMLEENLSAANSQPVSAAKTALERPN
jgi:hypothetical protein